MKSKIKIILSGLIVGITAFLIFHLYAYNKPFQSFKSSNASVITVKQEHKEKHSCCSGDIGENEFSSNSIYQLDSKWTDQSGNKIELSKFNGKPVVLTMFFASCAYACPVLVNDMKRIEAKLPEHERKNYQFVLVSIDPEHDTPQLLKKYAETHGLDPANWTLLTGSKDDVRELAAVLGFKYKKDANGQYSHSNLINILNSDGEVIHQHTGLNQDVTAAAEKLTEQNNL